MALVARARALNCCGVVRNSALLKFQSISSETCPLLVRDWPISTVFRVEPLYFKIGLAVSRAFDKIKTTLRFCMLRGDRNFRTRNRSPVGAFV
jgi:hypothetical protein